MQAFYFVGVRRTRVFYKGVSPRQVYLACLSHLLLLWTEISTIMKACLYLSCGWLCAGINTPCRRSWLQTSISKRSNATRYVLTNTLHFGCEVWDGIYVNSRLFALYCCHILTSVQHRAMRSGREGYTWYWTCANSQPCCMRDAFLWGVMSVKMTCQCWVKSFWCWIYEWQAGIMYSDA